jgi:DNA invertase Pin-like site-specific DNA recombinase
VTGAQIGYARCSTDQQPFEAEGRQIPFDLGVSVDRIHVNRTCCGISRARPGLDQALRPVRPGDTLLVVPTLGRITRSKADARQIGDSPTARQMRLQRGTMTHDSIDPIGKMFFNILVHTSRPTVSQALEHAQTPSAAV